MSIPTPRADKKSAYSAEELEFLPAALEVLQTPAPTASRLLGWTIVALFALAATWAACGHVDTVVVAEGELIPDGHTKAVQAARAGVIDALLVQDGQFVTQGEPLLHLDRAQDDARIAQLERALNAAGAELAHIEARLSALKGRRSAFAATHTAQASPQASAQAMSQSTSGLASGLATASYTPRLHSELNQYALTQQTLTAELGRARARRAIAKASLRKTVALLPLGLEREESLHKLVLRGAVARPNWLAAKESLLTLQHDRQILSRQLSEADLSVTLAEGVLSQHEADVRAQLELARVQASEQFKSARLDLLRASQQLDETVITAPISGTVHALSVHTVGGVVAAGEKLMEVVPSDSRLLALARIKQQDMGFVRLDHPIEIKLASFPFTKYGLIEGKAEQISADATHTKEHGSVYLMRVGFTEHSILVDGEPTPLAPGMQLHAEVKTGQRTILEFILEPVIRGISESLRER